jgi:hypothetical protein
MEMNVDVVCSWCSKHLGTKKFLTDDVINKHRISHSICNSCKDELLSEYKAAVVKQNKAQISEPSSFFPLSF